MTYKSHPLLFLLLIALNCLAQAPPDSRRGEVDFHDRFNPTSFLSCCAQVYQGEIEGVGSVVLELRLSPRKAGRYSGRYFFTHAGHDIPFEGPMEALAESEPLAGEKGQPQHEGFDKPHAVWNVQKSGGCCLEGEWLDRHTGKTYPFHLQDVFLAATAKALGFEIDWPRDRDKLPDAYRFLQIQAIAKPVGEETVAGEVAYRMWEDPRTQIQYPRLTRHPDPAVMARINFLLEEKHGRFAAEMLWAQNGECESATSFKPTGIAKVSYLTPALMSMVEYGLFHFCEGEFYPYSHPVTFDLIRGEYLNWNRLFDLFVPGKDGAPRPNPAFQEWYAQLEQEDRKASPTAQDDEDDCSLLAKESWDAYFIEPGSLALEGTPRYGRCAPQAVLPFARLKPVLKPEGARYLFPQKASE
ncbi:MAG: hypothetical protein LBU11_06365 [Zoogloeaceae bacterium]|nr:hypothetical protein [Zoogloeaceae bacterium]